MSKGKRRAIKKLKSIPRCGLCGRVGKLRRTECCGNLVCDDWEKYVPFSFSRESCSRNHDCHTLCAFHHHEGHEGNWKDCPDCREAIQPTEMYVHNGMNEFNFETLAEIPEFEPTLCSACNCRIFLGFESYSIKGGEYLCRVCDAGPEFSQLWREKRD